MSDQQAGRRDKFASLKATQAQATQAQATQAQAAPQLATLAQTTQTHTTQEVKPVKRDKFASMAAQQGMSSNQPQDSKPPITNKPARRDKFASLAGTQKEKSANLETKVPYVPKRDKFASMAQRNAKPKRDKFSSMKQNQQDKSSSLSQESDQKESIDSASELVRTNEMLKKKISQRQQIFKDLEKAEGHTWNLILLAGESARTLTNLNVDESNSDLSELSKKYRDTLQNIHSLLSPHAAFVKAYQNHQEEEETKNMYAARVETRLSQEKRNVIQEFLRLEKQNEENDVSKHKKRKLEN